MEQRPRAGLALAVLTVLAAGLALHLPWLGRPFGFGEQAGGNYFGVFLRNYEKFGFLGLHGAPIGVTVVDDPTTTIAYMTHPPGLSWLYALFGTAEWQLRLTTVLGAIAAGIAMLPLLWRVHGGAVATLAGLLVVLAPNLAFYSQLNYEPVTLALGLWMLLGHRARCEAMREGRAVPRGATVLVAAMAFVGPWIDWFYVVFCAALVPMSLQRGWRGTLRPLVWPAIVSVVSLAAILAWRAHARAAVPAAAAMQIDHSVGALTQTFLSVRADLSTWLDAIVHQLRISYGWPMLAAAAVGLPLVFAASARLAGSLLVAAVLTPLLIPDHSLTHTMDYTPAAALSAWAAARAAEAVGGLCRLRPGGLRAAAVGLALVVGLAVQSARTIQRSCTDYYCAVGAVLTAAQGARDGHGDGPYFVAHGFAWFGYYVEGDYVLAPPVRDPQVLTPALAGLGDEVGARYLWLRSDEPSGPLADPPGLAGFLAPFPRERLPQLEIPVLVGDRQVCIREAWLVTLKRPVR
ncbi:MAG: hypothetical protein IPM29_23120 [Planctomycetes bacterium]|nr:hypothetical protein [Planctomycetota bacterium]